MTNDTLKDYLRKAGLLELYDPADQEKWLQLAHMIHHNAMTQGILRRERYLKGVVSMQQALLRTQSDELGALNDTLEPLGIASDASRVYLFENHLDDSQRLYMSQRAEWCAPGIIPELDNPELQNLSYDDFFPRWATQLSQGRAIRGLIEDFPPEEQEILGPQHILSILVIPLMVEQRFTGFIGFDDCTTPRVWNDLEVALLWAAASNIGMVLDQRRAQKALIHVNQEYEAARDAALEASRAKSTFLAKMSHELRTPLNAVIGYSEFLLEEMEEDAPESWQSDITRILRSGNHLLLMVNDLLDLSRIEVNGVQLQLQEVNAHDLLDEVVEMTHQLSQKNDNEFYLQIENDLGQLDTDAKMLKQILINLLTNAFKYTSQGKVGLHVSASSGSIVFDVKDTGIGMTPESIKRVFHAFVQADDSYTRDFEGVGLGLAITKRLCSALHACVEVESTLGEGSCFTVTLPRTHPEVQESNTTQMSSNIAAAH